MATQRQREYELVVVLTPEAAEAEAAVSVDRVAGFIADRGGSVSVRESWGVRRLAYPIQNYREGNYFLMRFELDAGETRELDQTLQASQDVLRHLVTIAEGPRPEPVEEKADEPSAAAEAEAPDEAVPSATEEGASAEAEPSAVAAEEGATAEVVTATAEAEEAPSAEAEATPEAAAETPAPEAEPPAAAESAEEPVASAEPEAEAAAPAEPEAEDKPAEQQERPA